MFDKMRSIGKSVKREIKVYQLVIQDERTPRPAKLLLGLAIGYALLPFDIVPDFIPLLGYLDDVVIIPSLVILALRLVPREVVEDCRAKARGL